MVRSTGDSKHVVLLMPTRHAYGKYLIIPAEDGSEYFIGVNLDGPMRQHYEINNFLVHCQKDLRTALKVAEADARWCPLLPDVARKAAMMPKLMTPKGGGRYTLSDGVLTLFGISYNYGGIEAAHLEQFREAIKEYCREHELALVRITLER